MEEWNKILEDTCEILLLKLWFHKGYDCGISQILCTLCYEEAKVYMILKN